MSQIILQIKSAFYTEKLSNYRTTALSRVATRNSKVCRWKTISTWQRTFSTIFSFPSLPQWHTRREMNETKKRERKIRLSLDSYCVINNILPSLTIHNSASIYGSLARRIGLLLVGFVFHYQKDLCVCVEICIVFRESNNTLVAAHTHTYPHDNFDKPHCFQTE